jgi:hypothetical protein
MRRIRCARCGISIDPRTAELDGGIGLVCPLCVDRQVRVAGDPMRLVTVAAIVVGGVVTIAVAAVALL